MNCRTIRCCFVISLTLMALLIAGDENKSANISVKFCAASIDTKTSSAVDGDEYLCECEAIVSPLDGKPAIKIDCTHNDDRIANLTNKLFGAEQQLPPSAAILILSYQLFTEIPQFVGDSLKHLDMSYNSISSVKDRNFIHVKNLARLELNDNAISTLAPNAFEQLTALSYLDLAGNQANFVLLRNSLQES